MKIVHKALILFFLLTLIGCSRVATIINYRDVSYGHTDQTADSNTKKLIYAACLNAGWSVEIGSNDLITATYIVGKNKHSALVDIEFKPTGYDLIYRNSTNLKYRQGAAPSEGVIHKNYNAWVRKLKRKIDAALKSPDSVDLSQLPDGIFAEAKHIEPMDTLSERQLQLCVDQPTNSVSGQVVVNRSMANLKTGAQVSCTSTAIVRMGQVLQLKGQKGNWFQVRSEDDDQQGWIFSAFVNQQ